MVNSSEQEEDQSFTVPAEPVPASTGQTIGLLPGRLEVASLEHLLQRSYNPENAWGRNHSDGKLTLLVRFQVWKAKARHVKALLRTSRELHLECSRLIMPLDILRSKKIKSHFLGRDSKF